MKRIRKKIRKPSVLIILAGIMLFTAFPVYADTDKDVVKEIRTMQEDILNWKTGQTGQDTLLSGETLDNAGQSGSDWYAFAGSRIGTVEGQAAYLSRLQDYVEKIYSDLDKNVSKMNATEWHRIALTVAACGGDPTAFGKDADGDTINLVADGTFHCLKGDPGKQGINGYAWALYLMDCKNYEVPEDALWTREKILDAILEKQYEDGGFALGGAKSSDADITAIVLTALAPYAEDPEVLSASEAAFARLSEIQKSDGTMVTYGERTSESTAWTLIALSAWNRNALTDKQFIKEGNTLYDALKLFQLEDGSFIHSLDGKEPETVGNHVSTYQMLYALEAGCRQLEGKNRLFDLMDAGAVTQEEIEKAGESLPELPLEETELQNAESESKSLTMILIIAAGVVLLVVAAAFILLRDKKHGKNQELFAPDDEDDEW